jgi:hypothetical protein
VGCSDGRVPDRRPAHQLLETGVALARACTVLAAPPASQPPARCAARADDLRHDGKVGPQVIPYQRFSKANLNTYVNPRDLCRSAAG